MRKAQPRTELAQSSEAGDSAETPATEPSRAKESDPDYLETLARGLQVMGAMGQGGSIADLSRLTGLPRPSVRRVLYTLCRLGYAKESARVFTLTPQVTRIAAAYMGTAGRSRMLQSFCEELAKAVGEITTVCVLDGDEQLHLGFGVPPNFVGVALGVGSRIPSYMTAGGRTIWAYKSDQEIDTFLSRIKPTARTESTITDKGQLKQAILQARAEGYCIADAQYSAEFKAVAFPIRVADGSIFGALTINARKTAFLSDARFAELTLHCQKEAARLGGIIS